MLPSPASSPAVRVPRYLRRYTICAQHRPTSPLAQSFTPDDALLRHYSCTSLPLPSSAAVPAPPARAHSLRQLRRKSANSSRSSLSITECSFHTAFDYSEYQSNTSNDPSLKNSPDSSDSAFASRGGQSSDDTVVSPPDGPKTEKNAYEGDDDWPVAFLTTITRRDLEQYDRENQKRHKRSFSWRRNQKPPSDNQPEPLQRRESRKLKKKRPSSLLIEQADVPATPFEPRIASIYSQGDDEEFDPLKHLHVEPVPDDPFYDTAEAIPSGDTPPTNDPLVDQEDEWEDMESSDHHHHHHHHHAYRKPMPSEDDAPPERLRSRTPQEILQGLDVVHEEEEEDNNSTVDAPAVALDKRASYPYIQNKGKERQESDDDDPIHKDTIEHDDVPIEKDSAEPEAPPREQEEEDTPTPPELVVPTQTQIPSSPPPPSQRRKLSKRRQSRRKLDTDSPPPPLPERNLKTKSKSNIKHKRSIPHLRPRRPTTTTTVISSVFRPLTSFALFLGIDVGSSTARKQRRRLSRELRTPNALLLGRHFSEKHIPRFPSRLDGKRTVDKKIAKYE